MTDLTDKQQANNPTKQYRGSCLCGTVAYQFFGSVNVFQYCHCKRCQKFTGSAHASNIIIPAENFEWLSGAEMVGRYELESTKYFATCFCKQCGSSLPWKEQTGKSVVIPAGTLDEDPGARPVHNIFWPSRPCWYEGKDELPSFDGLPK